jgi:hypothetical protein
VKPANKKAGESGFMLYLIISIASIAVAIGCLLYARKQTAYARKQMNIATTLAVKQAEEEREVHTGGTKPTSRPCKIALEPFHSPTRPRAAATVPRFARLVFLRRNVQLSLE